MGRAFRWGLMGSALLVVCLVSPARAQYFGRNKVQYDRDRVLVLSTAHFEIYYSQEDAAAAAIAGRMAERWHARLSMVLDHALTGRQLIVLYGSHRRFQQNNIYGGLIEETARLAAPRARYSTPCSRVASLSPSWSCGYRSGAR